VDGCVCAHNGQLIHNNGPHQASTDAPHTCANARLGHVAHTRQQLMHPTPVHGPYKWPTPGSNSPTTSSLRPATFLPSCASTSKYRIPCAPAHASVCVCAITHACRASHHQGNRVHKAAPAGTPAEQARAGRGMVHTKCDMARVMKHDMT